MVVLNDRITYFRFLNPLFYLELLALLPISFLLAYRYLPKFRSDACVFTPKNIMLFVWFNKLVIIPIELFLIGNKVLLFNIQNHDLHTEIYILLASFTAFCIGFYTYDPSKYKAQKSKDSSKIFAITTTVFAVIGLCSIVIFHGSLNNYLTDSWLTPHVRQNLDRLGGTVIGYLSNIGQRFLPFAVILSWIWFTKYFTKNLIINTLFLLLCFFCTLSSNRSNTFYPLLTLLSIMAVSFKLKNKIGILALVFVLIMLSFFFGFVRSYEQIDWQHIGHLFMAYLSDNEYVWYAHQIYFGTPHQITPLLHSDIPFQFTLLPSLLDPVPVIGKAFREQSGPFLYNLLIYNSTDVQDKIIPVAGELFYNGGYGLVVVAHLLIGRVYAWLDVVFKQNSALNPAIAMSIFYISLLFNATLLLSISVLVQYLVFNAAPVVLIFILFSRKNESPHRITYFRT